METNIKKSMLRALMPVIKDTARAQAIMERFWQDKMAVVWITKDVHRAANEIDVALTEKEACQLLKDLHAQYNRHEGIKWQDIIARIQNEVLGRKMTCREVNQFVKKDIITIQK